MASSDPKAPQAPDTDREEPTAQAQAEAQRAADSLKGQIAALRAQVRTAQDRLRADPKRPAKEPRSFKG